MSECQCGLAVHNLTTTLCILRKRISPTERLFQEKNLRDFLENVRNKCGISEGLEEVARFAMAGPALQSDNPDLADMKLGALLWGCMQREAGIFIG